MIEPPTTVNLLSAFLLPLLLCPTSHDAQQAASEGPEAISHWKSRNAHGNLVEYSASSQWQRESTFDDEGRQVSIVLRRSDGSVQQQHSAYAVSAPTAEGTAGAEHPSAVGTNLTSEEFQSYVQQLPPLPPWTQSLRETALGFDGPAADDAGSGAPNHPWGHYTSEVREGWARSRVELLGAKMQVTAVVLDSDWVHLTDDWGGYRFDRVSETSAFGGSHGGRLPAVTSLDRIGPIVQVVTNSSGFPVETWYGETFFVRYHYPQLTASEILLEGGADGLWSEFIDARTGEILLDSRALGRTGSAPRFEAAGGVVESLGEGLFVPVRIRHGLYSRMHRYALIPLDGGILWRSVETGGTGEPMLWSRVDYTDSLLRVHVRLDDGDLIFEAPRGGSDRVRIIHPEKVDLPLQLASPAAVRRIRTRA